MNVVMFFYFFHQIFARLFSKGFPSLWFGFYWTQLLTNIEQFHISFSSRRMTREYILYLFFFLSFFFPAISTTPLSLQSLYIYIYMWGMLFFFLHVIYVYMFPLLYTLAYESNCSPSSWITFIVLWPHYSFSFITSAVKCVVYTMYKYIDVTPRNISHPGAKLRKYVFIEWMRGGI